MTIIWRRSAGLTGGEEKRTYAAAAQSLLLQSGVQHNRRQIVGDAFRRRVPILKNNFQIASAVPAALGFYRRFPLVQRPVDKIVGLLAVAADGPHHMPLAFA